MDDLNRAIVDILKREARPVTTAELGRLLAAQGRSASQPTLSRRLAALNGKRYVSSNQAGRGLVHRYDGYQDWFAQPPSKRPKLGYDPSMLRGYEPNRTAWLSRQELARLHAAGGERRLDGSTYARAIAQKLLVDLSYASSALEGNTYSYLDTQVLIEFGQAAEGKQASETQMILNHKEAILYLVENIDDIIIDARELKTLHALLARGLLADPNAVGGVRRRMVDIGGSAYVPMANPHQLEEELSLIAQKAAEIDEPFEQSMFLMVFLSYLQAFEDVNKRAARLACNIPLLKGGIAPLSFMEMDKTAYVRGLLSVYELRRVDVLKDAFIEGYVRSAGLYDAYAARDRAAIELEMRRRTDIYGAVAAYVRSVVEAGKPVDPGAYLSERFAGEDEPVRGVLISRIRAIVDALHEGNHAAYGISRKLYGEYEEIHAPRPADGRDNAETTMDPQ